MRIEETRTIGASAERTYDIICDVTRWPEWTPSAIRVEVLTPGEFAVGSKARATMRGVPVSTWEVTALEPGRSFTWQSKSPGAKAVAGHEMIPDGDGCRATLWIEITGVAAVLLWPMIVGRSRRNVRDEADGLKARAEGRK